jgi:hypothetical protein
LNSANKSFFSTVSTKPFLVSQRDVDGAGKVGGVAVGNGPQEHRNVMH